MQANSFLFDATVRAEAAAAHAALAGDHLLQAAHHLLDGVQHDFVAHEAMVDEAVLFVGFTFCEGGFGDGAVEPQRAVAAVDF